MTSGVEQGKSGECQGKVERIGSKEKARGEDEHGGGKGGGWTPRSSTSTHRDVLRDGCESTGWDSPLGGEQSSSGGQAAAEGSRQQQLLRGQTAGTAVGVW